MRRHSWSAFAVVVLAVAFATSAAADSHPSIVNGSPAAPGEYPAQGFLQIDTDGDGLGDSQCGGTLVGNRYFLTAAHCVDDGTGLPFPPSRFLVGLGNLKVSQITDVYDVVSVDENAAFDLGTNGNDTAMLKFSRPAPYTPLRVIGIGDGPKWAGFKPELEDIHMCVESALTERIGDPAPRREDDRVLDRLIARGQGQRFVGDTETETDAADAGLEVGDDPHQ